MFFKIYKYFLKVVAQSFLVVIQQNDGVAMGSPLGPLLAGLFMVELEVRIIPMVTDSIYHCS